ncbi:MAG: hypothetical protein AAFV93_07790 [Chloroflexota bacterium]
MKPVTIETIHKALEKSWSIHSSTKWREDNPALGQCGVTAMVVQDHLGGEILKTKYGDIWHFYNLIDETPIDFTKSQFEAPLDYDNHLSTRDEAFSDTNSQQYSHLSTAVQQCLNDD